LAVNGVYLMTIPSDIQDFFIAMLDPDRCREWLIDRLHPGGPACPRCGYVPKLRAAASWRKGKRVCCYDCKKYYTAWAGTILSGAHMVPSELALMFYLMGLNLPDRVIAERLQVSTDTIKLWRKKLEIGCRGDPCDRP